MVSHGFSLLKHLLQIFQRTNARRDGHGGEEERNEREKKEKKKERREKKEKEKNCFLV